MRTGRMPFGSQHQLMDSLSITLGSAVRRTQLFFAASRITPATRCRNSSLLPSLPVGFTHVAKDYQSSES